MIKAKGTVEGRETLILGLSTRNIWGLQKNEPIRFDGRPYGVDMDILIMWGVDESAMAEALGIDPENPSPVKVTDERNAP